jgi:predicted DNA-binding protein with PD1-like motif
MKLPLSDSLNEREGAFYHIHAAGGGEEGYQKCG